MCLHWASNPKHLTYCRLCIPFPSTAGTDPAIKTLRTINKHLLNFSLQPLFDDLLSVKMHESPLKNGSVLNRCQRLRSPNSEGLTWQRRSFLSIVPFEKVHISLLPCPFLNMPAFPKSTATCLLWVLHHYRCPAGDPRPSACHPKAQVSRTGETGTMGPRSVVRCRSAHHSQK